MNETFQEQPEINFSGFINDWEKSDIPNKQILAEQLSQLKDENMGQAVLANLDERYMKASDKEKSILVSAFENIGIQCPGVEAASTDVLLSLARQEGNKQEIFTALQNKTISLFRQTSQGRDFSPYIEKVFNTFMSSFSQRNLSEEERLSIVTGISKFGEQPKLKGELNDFLRDVFKSDNSQLSKAALPELVEITDAGDTSLIYPILEKISEVDINKSEIIIPYIIMLEKIGDLSCAETLNQLEDSSEESVKIAAERAIAKIEERENAK